MSATGEIRKYPGRWGVHTTVRTRVSKQNKYDPVDKKRTVYGGL